MKWYYLTAVIVVTAAVFMWGGVEYFKGKHGCSVDATGKATCTK